MLRFPSVSPAAAPPHPRRPYGGAATFPHHHSFFTHLRRHKSLPSASSLAAAAADTPTSEAFDSELRRLLALLPVPMRSKLSVHPDLHSLIEIVMDLGRTPLARFPSGDFLLSDHPISSEDLEKAASQVGDFAGDNRAGISRTLHRISAIRNRKGDIVGLTCRVGRAVTRSADSIRDLVRDGASLLLIGPPGVGKTTIIREIARILADEYKKRVMIVDTSNEIGGDGDVPHPGIGNARRMQVPDPSMQHKVLIEAVENHMPQAIVIDEIGTKLEAMAASTIAQRGIQLVATAHGITIDNLVMNPSLDLLVGGIQSVTLGDEEASRRGVQKTILERKGPSTFACAAEIISKTELRVHRSLEATVDDLLSGRAPKVESRQIYSNREADKMDPLQSETTVNISSHTRDKRDKLAVEILDSNDGKTRNNEYLSQPAKKMATDFCEDQVVLQLYIYGILEASVVQAINKMKLEDVIVLTQDISEADVFLALHSKLKKNPRIEAVAKTNGIPIYVTKTGSLENITKAIRSLSSKYVNGVKEYASEDEMSSSEKADALEEARLAIEQFVIPKGEMVELLPRPSYIISAQKDLVHKYNLKSVKVGKEPDAYLRVLPVCNAMDDRSSTKLGDDDADFLEYGYSDGMDGFQHGVTRLPLLPE